MSDRIPIGESYYGQQSSRQRQRMSPRRRRRTASRSPSLTPLSSSPSNMTSLLLDGGSRETPGTQTSVLDVHAERLAAISLESLRAALPHVDSLLLHEVWIAMGQDADRVLEYFAPARSEAPRTPELPTDRLSSLPDPLYWRILMQLNYADKAKLAQVSRLTCRRAREDFGSTRVLRVHRRLADVSDEALLRMVACFPSLESLTVRSERFESFARLPGVLATTLRTLDLAGCAITDDEVFGLLVAAPWLTSLTLSGTDITGAGIRRAAQSPAVRHMSLQRLELSKCMYMDASAVSAAIRRFPHLRELVLRSTPSRVVRADLFQRVGFGSLHCLDLTGCKGFGRWTLQTERSECLRELRMDACQSLEFLRVESPTMQRLRLRNNTNLRQLELCTPNLTHLDVSQCRNLRSISLTNCKLEFLNVENCRALVVPSFRHLVRNGQLRHVSVAFNRILSNEAVQALLESRTLQKIDVRGCRMLSDEVHAHVQQLNKSLSPALPDFDRPVEHSCLVERNGPPKDVSAETSTNMPTNTPTNMPQFPPLPDEDHDTDMADLVAAALERHQKTPSRRRTRHRKRTPHSKSSSATGSACSSTCSTPPSCD
ncbi:MAG: hypothetical protein MHM6MM_003410 [Cercozoa sp. M6MM]